MRRNCSGGRKNRRGNQGNSRSKIGKKVEEQVEDALDDLTPHRRGQRRRSDDNDDAQDSNDKQPERPPYDPSKRLPKSARDKIRNIPEWEHSTAREALLGRGGAASAFREARSDYLDKSVGELAYLAAGGDADAETILKLIKQAGSKAQKYGGKS